MRLLPPGLVAVAAVGCATLPPLTIDPRIRYEPPPSGATPATSVSLLVEDARPEGSGPGVGRLRSSVSGTLVVHDQRPDVVAATVASATTEALGGVGVGLRPGGKRLTASVRRYWLTGECGYSMAGAYNTDFDATIDVSYRLLDDAGQPLWAADVSVRSLGGDLNKGPKTMTEDIFAQALGKLSRRAREQFAAAPFQQAVAR
jgi:hypothetical protein